MKFSHKSVLLNETIEGLRIKPEGIYVDGTLGGGGHALEVVKRLEGRFFGIDQDEAAIEAATERLGDHMGKITLIRDNYENAVSRLKEQGICGVDGIVLDLGVSSYQLDTVERGFSYKDDTAVDMRMDTGLKRKGNRKRLFPEGSCKDYQGLRRRQVCQQYS